MTADRAAGMAALSAVSIMHARPDDAGTGTVHPGVQPRLYFVVN